MNILPTFKVSCLVVASLASSLAPVRGQDFASMRTAGALAASVPPPTTTVAGIMVSNDNWSSSAPEAGVYTVEVREGGKITAQYRSSAMAEVVSALKKDNVMYTIEATQAGQFYYWQMSLSNWQTVGSRQEIDVVNVASDLTYDPVTAKAYGGFWDDDYQGFSRFGSFDLTSAEATDINTAGRDERDIFAIAADGKGTIYCLFGAYDYLGTLDPATGQITRIKKLDLDPYANVTEGRVSSMCYDAENDRLIAAVYQEKGYGASKERFSALYTINPHTGDLAKVMDFPGNACFAGLYVEDAAPVAEAPGAPTGLKLNLDESGTTGTISFTAPQTSMGGAALSGTLMAIVNLNGVESVISGIMPGSPMRTPQLVFADGENTVKITMADTERRGGSATLTFWAGTDAPAPVSDVRLSVFGGKATLTWTAPETGAHGGDIDTDALRYRIVRMPENVVVAEAATGTAFEDTNVNTAVKTIYYTVSAYNAAGSAAGVESNRCLSAGSFSVPFSEGFDTKDDFDLWTIENVNGGSTWSYNNGTTDKCAQYKYDDNKLPGDDWLISPAIRLEAGKTYKASYSWRAMNRTYPESFEVFLGDAPGSKNMTVELGRHENIKNTSFETASKAFSVEADGDYYIGVHNFSAGYMYILLVDNISVVEVDNRVPATVADLSVEPGAKGARTATVRFTAPELDNKGGRLETISSASISRNGQVIHTITDGLVPGKEVVYEDKTVGADGLMTYSVVCANEVGDGVAATCAVYVGTDAPGAVGNLTISEKDRHPYLTWTAPVSGTNGGWFDAEAVVYRIVRSDGTVVSENCTALEFTDASYTVPTKGQDALWYLVTPYAGTLKGLFAQSELMLYGTPYPAPATENFGNADMTYYPWISQSAGAVNYAWTLDNMGYNPQTADQSGDRGLATFHSVGEPAGVESYFYSPKFDISGLESPVVSFYLYHSAAAGDETMDVLVAAGTDVFEPLEGATTIRRDAAEGWKRYTFSLKAYKAAPWVRVGFKGTGAGVADIYIDNVVIDSQAAVDLALTSLSAPARIAAGETIECEAAVINTGISAVEGATLRITDASGTELAAIQVPALAAGEDAVVKLAVEAARIGSLSLDAQLQVAGDENPANNKASASVSVVTPVVNAPANLEGTLKAGVIDLSWDAPSERGAVTDDVESYKDFAIDGIGQWTMWDGDYDVTYMINTSYGDYPNSTARKAFQICNSQVLGIDVWDEGKPHSGNKMFMAMASYVYVNNDWLISPRLNGKEQWISFYARSFTLQNSPAERMRVWCSSTDNDPANFTEITGDYVELPGTWVEHRYYMPEGTRYFAINCVSDGAFAMFVDDICYNDLTVPTWTLTGYEVYRDGEKIGETTDPEYHDYHGEPGRYTVRAVYDRGEGPMSEAVAIVNNGAGEVAAQAITAEGAKGEVVVRGASDIYVEVMTAAGTDVFRGFSGRDELRVAAAPGVYIVRAGQTAIKIVVR